MQNEKYLFVLQEALGQFRRSRCNNFLKISILQHENFTQGGPGGPLDKFPLDCSLHLGLKKVAKVAKAEICFA